MYRSMREANFVNRMKDKIRGFQLGKKAKYLQGLQNLAGLNIICNKYQLIVTSYRISKDLLKF